MSTDKKYRLVTRSDFDGLVCAALLRERDVIGDILFVHPKDVQDGKIEITPQDITTNLPYSPKAHLVFDHHHSEKLRDGTPHTNMVLDEHAPSTAAVLYNYLGGASTFPPLYKWLIEACNKADSAQFTLDDILHPQGWTLINFLMDPRTGLGRFRSFRLSNYDLMQELISECRTREVEDILELPDVKERVALYNEHHDKAIEQIRRCTTVHGNVLVLDLRNEETIWPTNRFTVYALYPECNVSIHVLWGLKQQNVVFAMGKSILDRSCPVDIGELALKYQGGGHEAAGTCQIDTDKAEAVLPKLIAALTE